MTIEGKVVMTSSKFQPGDTVRNGNPTSRYCGMVGMYQRVRSEGSEAK